MNDGENVTPETQLAEFRRQANLLGFRDEVEVPPDLESADAFVERMKAQNPGDATSGDATLGEHRGQRRWFLTAAVGVAAAALAVVVVFRPSGEPVAADTPPVLDFEFAAAVRIAYAPGEDATSALEELAAAAKNAPPESGAGPIQHHVGDNWFSDQDDTGSSVITPRVSETWLLPDGSLITRDAVGAQLTSDGRGIPVDGPDYSGEATTGRLPAGTVDADFPDDLSTNPDELRTQLLDNIGCAAAGNRSDARSFCLFSEVTALFNSYVVPPEIASAVWTMLRGEAGFTSLGSVKDRAGRDGLALSLVPADKPNYRFILIVNNQNGQLLGAEEVLIKPDPGLSVKAPSVVSFSTIVVSERTRTAPAVN